MKQWIVLTILFFFYVLNQVYADSTELKPPYPLAPQSKVTANVLHLTKAIPFNTISSYQCPSGSTFVSSKFYPSNTEGEPCEKADRPGFYAYTCTQTFASNDSEYIALINDNSKIPWRNCLENSNVKCSIKLTKPNLIVFKVVVPSADQQGYNKNFDTSTRQSGYVSFYDVVLTAHFSDLPISSEWVWARRDTNICSYAEVSYTYSKYPDPLEMYWYLDSKARRASDKWYSSAMGSNASSEIAAFRCQPKTGPNAYGGVFTLPISAGMAGQTCTFTCSGYWELVSTSNYFYSDRASVSCVY